MSEKLEWFVLNNAMPVRESERDAMAQELFCDPRHVRAGYQWTGDSMVVTFYFGDHAEVFDVAVRRTAVVPRVFKTEECEHGKVKP